MSMKLRRASRHLIHRARCLAYGAAAALTLALQCPLAMALSMDVRNARNYFGNPGNAEATRYIPFLDGHAPVHEDLTDAALSCGTVGSPCDRLAVLGITRDSIIEGVHSNDFPAQYLTERAAFWCTGRVLRITIDADVPCIMGSFARASKSRAKFANRSWALERPLGMRGHFGDLQFMHSMAPAGQTAGETYDRIHNWMEFAYKASYGAFNLRGDAHAVSIPGFDKMFVRGARRVGDLLDYRFNSAHLRASGIALGQMLHIGQDSFAGCHTERDADGRMLRFLNYAAQDAKTHAHFDEDKDKIDAFTRKRLNPVDFGSRLLSMRADGKSWEEVEPLIAEYFKPLEDTTNSSAGAQCKAQTQQ
jgi:hypothetical protein